VADIESTVEKISQTLACRGGRLSSVEVLETLRDDGVSPEIASTAIAAGAQSGAFDVDSAFFLTRPESVAH
jgi:hypothetical protein